MFINGAWEIRQGRNICRSMLVWQIIDEKNFVGVVAGYSGGGGFQLEQFAATVQDSSLVSLMIDTEDKITGKEINFFEEISHPDFFSLSIILTPLETSSAFC